ncbi:four helix bundle protein [Dokdonella soli]|uniref:Four helix bundle protein n=1 Tax=Dokdonella soli TaxID=529810 RepID=A0ABN1IUZ3_9GAMM
MSFVPPPVVKASERLLVDVEIVVRRFARYHKYSIGSDLRADAKTVARLAHRAWRDRSHQQDLVAQLVRAVDDFKITLQLGSQVKAFPSFAQFEALARLVRDLGKQVGGWHRQHCTPKGQSAASDVSPQRAQILSTRAASIGANS